MLAQIALAIFNSSLIPIMAVLSSAITGVFIFILRQDQNRLRITLNALGALTKISLITFMAYHIYRGESFQAEFTLIPGFQFSLVADPLAMLFAILSSFLWLITTIYAIGYLKDSPDKSRFFGFFSLCVTASIGIAFSGNLLTFLLFYEFLTLSTYPLLTHKGTPDVIKAGRIYLVYTLSGGVLLLLGTIGLAIISGGTSFDSGETLKQIVGNYPPYIFYILFWTLIIGIGVKAALFPLHGWLPIGMVAPAPVSALLHAVAVVKAGAFGIIRVVYDVFGLELFAQHFSLATPLTIWAAITILYGSIMALKQENIKKRLAYSTVSQLSYITLGVAMAGPVATIGGLVHLVHQGLMKITLFFCAGNLIHGPKVTSIGQLNGIARKMPWTMLCFSIAALGMIGIPPMAGFISKWFLAIGAIESGQEWIMLVLIASSVLNAMYFLPLIYRAWFLTPFTDKQARWSLSEKTTSFWLLLPPIITAALTLLAGLFAGLDISPLNWAIFIVTEIYLL